LLRDPLYSRTHLSEYVIGEGMQIVRVREAIANEIRSRVEQVRVHQRAAVLIRQCKRNIPNYPRRFATHSTKKLMRCPYSERDHPVIPSQLLIST